MPFIIIVLTLRIFHLLTGKMTKLSLAEKKKLMQAARAARMNSWDVVPLQSDKAGLEIRQSKRAKGVTT